MNNDTGSAQKDSWSLDDSESRRRRKEFAAHEQPLVEELRTLGLDVRSIPDLVKSGKKYPEAIPTLLKWLPRVTYNALKMSIVRTLSVPFARGAAGPVLLREFERSDELTQYVRWEIGNALHVVATKTDVDHLLRLARDRRYGADRQMIVLALGRFPRADVVAELIGLLDDDDVIAHAIDALGRLRAESAAPKLEPLLSHARPLVRREAAKALKRIRQ